MIRPATLRDLSALLQIETACFNSDKLSRRSLRRMITNPQAVMLVHEKQNQLAGYILTFRHQRSKLARHYSLAVLPDYRKQGVAEALLSAAENACADKEGCKLELRPDNHGALRLYERLGYKRRRIRESFYEDGSNAIEMVKWH